MADRERVVKGLEYCTQHGRLCGRDCNGHWGWTDGSHTSMELLGEYRTKCPYGNCETGCVKTLTKDALALLKAQEPRVMTLSGVRNLKESTPVWLEDADKKDVIGALFMRDYSGTKCVDFAIVRDWEHERVTADYMDYGIRWRVWTSRPDQATREATPWQ